MLLPSIVCRWSYNYRDRDCSVVVVACLYLALCPGLLCRLSCVSFCFWYIFCLFGVFCF